MRQQFEPVIIPGTYARLVPPANLMPCLPLVPGRRGVSAVPLRPVRRRRRRLLIAFTVLVLAACGSPFSDAQVGAGERLVPTDLYAVVVPEAAEQKGEARDRISMTWPGAGGRITATVDQEDVTVLRNAGDLTRRPTTVAGVEVERLDADLRRVTAAEPGDRIRYRVSVNRLPLPSANRPTEIELHLMAAASLSEADVQAFRDSAQRFLDRVQVRGR